MLTIHFPSDLDHILNNLWAYYSSYGHALYDSIIQIQTSIIVQRKKAQELTLAKRREKRQAMRAFDDDDSGPLTSSNSDTEPSEETIQELPEQHLEKSLGHKRQALEEMTNSAK